ncbi:uncharacterized protein LOC143290916 [Babylonia areolata]|uniref:uncharacterized protein LOC143290916 n=1 Tax=Babylonia areolata TaxID=304850 RepID=UPI003FD04748
MSNIRSISGDSRGDNTAASPTGPDTASLTRTPLQIRPPPPTTFSPLRSPSSSSTHTSFELKSRASTRQSHLSAATSSNWTSVSGVSQPSPHPTPPPLKPYFYPTSGYPVSKSILQQAYPGNGYPVSTLQHSYGYPASNFPCCEVPGVTDLGSQFMYPSCEFPGGGAFPGEIEQDDGSAPFVSGLEQDASSDPASFIGGGAILPGAGGQGSFLPAADTMYTPGEFDPHYNAGYPV